MSHNRQNIENYHAGDSLHIITQVEDSDGNIISIENADIEWELTEEEGDTEKLVEKNSENPEEIEITDAENGEFTVYVAAGDTEGMTGEHHHRARVIDSNGNRVTVFTGSIMIDK